MKKHLLALVLILVCLLSVLTPAVHAEEPELTRIEWVQQLVTTFDMTVEDDNYPDNYYSDIESSASYYRNLMVAVEFGVIDIEAGGEFRPQDPATREFAAHTLNYCVGFQLEDGAAYTYADSAETSYPDDLQVAVNRGWFVLSDGKILPEQNVTPAEASAMLTDAAQLLKELELSDNYENTYTFATDIIEVPDGTEVIATDDTSISITDCPVTITQGDVFVVYLNEIPVPYIAGSVTQSGSVTVISATLADDETVFAGIDAQGTVVGDLRQAEASDGTELAYYVEATEQGYQTYEAALAAVERLPATQAAGSISPKGISLSCKKELKLGDAVTLSVDGKIKNVTVSYKISLAEGVAYVKLAYDLDVTYKVKGNYIPTSCISNINDITFVYWGVPGVGGFKITYDVELSGSFSGVQSWHKELGMSVSRSDGFRLIRDFKAKTFTMVAEATFQVGFKAKFGVTELPAFNAYAYASMGSVGKLKIQTYQDDAAPQKCMHFAAYLYAECGLQGSAKLIIKETVSLKYEIFNAKNSPIRISHHYEDGVLVAKCTRDANKNWFNDAIGSGGGGSRGYYTPGSSGYMASGWSGGSSNTGWENGNPVVIYTYTTDDNGNATITSYNGKASGLVIPATIDGHTVVAIGKNVFKNNSRLKAVIIPDTVTKIGENAFDGANLQTVSIPDSVTKIEMYAFSSCKGLTEVRLPAGLKELGGMAFGECSGLTEITIPKSLTTAYSSPYGNRGGPFGNCENLTTVIFEDGITKVPAYLFRGCTGKIEPVLPDTITEIGHEAFMNSGLQSIVIPDNVTVIGENAFDGSNLQTVSIPDSVTKIEMYAFSSCKGLTEVRLPAGLKELGGMAFGECSGLTEITIPKSLTIAYSSPYGNRGGPFGNCENLTTAIFEDGITKIPAYLFRCCTGKIRTVLPDGITEIGREAFMNSGLQSIVMPDTVTRIEENAFRESMLQTVSIPDSVTKIGQYVFYNCQDLTEVKLSAGLEEIGEYAFADSGLKSVSIPDTVTKTGGATFKNCFALTDAKLSNSCTNINYSMFEGCSALRKILIPDTVTTVYNSAFQNCTSLKEVIWSESLVTLRKNAFYNCSSLTEVVLPEKVTTIGDSVFYNCDSLTAVTIPDSVTSFGTSMFYDCDALVTVNLGSGLTAIPKSSFEHCDVLESVTVPRRVTSIAADAFKNSVKFTSIFIPRSVTSIDSTAFSYPAKLTIYGVPGTYAETFANENSITFVAQQTGATAVALDQTTLSLAKGSSAQLKLTVTPENFTYAVTWKSADTSVATVSDTGLVKAVNNGSTVIKVTVGSVSASCKVTVVQPVTGISLNRTSLTLEALGTFQLTARIIPANAEDPRVRWSSSAPEIAAVSDTGLVTALKKGTAVITVTSMDGSNISRTCTVTVSNTAYICKTADELESPHNYENSCTDVWSYTLPGATELNVTFDTRTCMEDGFDFLYLYDANGTEIGKYTGTELAGKTITIPGDTVRIKMASDDSGNEWGFKAQVRADAGELANGVTWSFRSSENTLSINGAILEGHKVLIACYDDNGRLTKLEVWTVSGSVKLPDSARIRVFYIDEANKPLCAAATVCG